MAKLALPAGTTDVTVYVWIGDSSSTTGAGLTGLVYNSASLTCYYVRPLAAAAALTLATQTVTGAHSDGGFVEVDSTNMPGLYRLDLSDAICAASADFAIVHLKGAANMAPVTLELDLRTQEVNTTLIEGSDATDQINAACDTALTDYDAPTKAEMDAGFAAQNDLSSSQVASAVWSEGLPGLYGAGQAGKILDDVLTDTGTTLPATLTSMTSTLDGNEAKLTVIDGNVDDILVDTDVTIPLQISSLNDPTSAAIADAVLDEALSGHVTAGTLGKAVADIESDATAILADTNELQANQGDWATATGFATSAALATHDGKLDTVDTNVDAILVDTGTTIPAQISGLNDVSSADVTTACTSSLNTYDPPTKAELDSGLAGLNDPTAAAIADQVWEEAIADHSGTAGSTAEALDNAGAGGTPPSAAAIADAVWDEDITTHSTADTAGEAQQNLIEGISDQVWNTQSGLYLNPGTFGAYLDAKVSSINSVSIAPLTAQQVSLMRITQDIVLYQDTGSPVLEWSIVDSNGTAVDLTGDSLRFNVVSLGNTTSDWTQTGVVGGALNNEVTVTYTSDNTASTGVFEYYLWNITTGELLKTGVLEIRKTVKDAAV